MCFLGGREKLTGMPTPEAQNFADQWVQAGTSRVSSFACYSLRGAGRPTADHGQKSNLTAHGPTCIAPAIGAWPDWS
ncbi:MAG: hypothetical protein NVSMB60_12640 [Mycobacterium sp.]